MQNLFKPTVLSASPPELANRFRQFLDDPATRKLDVLRTNLRQLVEGKSVSFEGTDWGAIIEQRAVTLAGFSDQYQKEFSQIVDDLAATAWRSLMTSLGIGFGILLCAGGLSIGASRFLSGVLSQLAASMTKLAGDNLDVTIADRDRTDEIGGMARAVEVFRQAAVRNKQLEADARLERSRAEHLRIDAQQEADRNAEQRLDHATATFADGLIKLASGNMLCEINISMAPQFEKLRHDFNDSVMQLRDALQSVGQSAALIGSGTGEIHAAASDLSRRTEQQAASLEETAAALDEITTAVKKTAQAASQARDVVSTTKTSAEQSGAVVSQAVEAMSAIEASSRKIGQIIGVIDEIAFQTNLLALNAGVEAARAGEAGRGFAVVASEVRALAQRSAEAAKEIKALISTSSSQVGHGVTLVGQTGKVLNGIVSQIGQLNTIVGDIAASAGEQATSLEQVNVSINQMDQVTQQNAAMVEQTTAAVGNLANEGRTLGEIVGRFKVGESIRQSARLSTPRPSRPVAVRGSRRGGAPGTAALQVPNHAEEAWAEF